MPEGDTIYRTAAALRRALLGRTLTGFETSRCEVEAAAARHPLPGREIAGVEARGMHLLITFSTLPPRSPSPAVGEPAGTAMVLHSHMRMTGSWHLYRPGEYWQKPAWLAVAVLRTEALVVPCFSAPVMELLTAWQAVRHPDLLALGPDAITEEFDAAAAVERFRRRPELPVGVALMNQRLMAGVGNVYKSEVLFIRRLSPFAPVGTLDEDQLSALVAEASRLLRLNRERGVRRTRFGLEEQERLWVYGRGGEPCRVCGTPIRVTRQGLDARTTYYCPRCQGTE